jgi:hypothetical protein
MLGIASFAQTPFSALAGKIFPFDIAEGIALNDSSTQLSAFLQSIAENSVLDDIDATTGDYFALVYEDTGVADLSTPLFAYLQSISENSNPADSASVQADLIFAITENSIVNDTPTEYLEFLFSISESISNVADSSTQQWDFNQTIAENVTVDNIQTIVFSFTDVIIETIQADDVFVGGTAYLQSLTEAISVGDVNIGDVIFNLSVSENITSADAADAVRGFYFVIAEDSQMLFGTQTQSNFLQSIAENIVMKQVTKDTSWLKIITVEDANWTIINTQ